MYTQCPYIYIYMRSYIPASVRPMIGSLFVMSKLLVIQLDTRNYLVKTMSYVYGLLFPEMS